MDARDGAWLVRRGRPRHRTGTGTAVWHHPGLAILRLRWVLVRDPVGRFDPQALLSTNLTLTAAEVVSYFVHRWQVEVTFEEARRHLGLETQRQWSDRAIARTTPVLLGLFSLVTLLATRLVRDGQLPVRTSAWYTNRCRLSATRSPPCGVRAGEPVSTPPPARAARHVVSAGAPPIGHDARVAPRGAAHDWATAPFLGTRANIGHRPPLDNRFTPRCSEVP